MAPIYIYVVEPMRIFEKAPNVADKKFSGNPTRYYRSKTPVLALGYLRLST